MVAHNLRELGARLMEPLVSRIHFNPSWLTLVSIITAVAVGVVFGYADHGSPLLLAASALVGITALLDGLDGQVARAQGVASPRGDLLDHTIDRVADILMIGGLALGPLVNERLGFAAVLGVLLLSYMGTQAQAVGAERIYGGLLGRADRLFVLIAAPVVQYLLDHFDHGTPGGLSLMAWICALFAVVCTLSAGYRFVKVWYALKRAETEEKKSAETEPSP